MALLKSNTSLQTQGKLLKTILIKNVKIITLAMLVCDLLGVKTDSIDYTNKLDDDNFLNDNFRVWSLGCKWQ
jgi:hypothetical protein